jgi:hypothetical protein
LVKTGSDGRRNQPACGDSQVRVVPMRHRQPVVRFKVPRQSFVTHARNDVSSSLPTESLPVENTVCYPAANPASSSEAHSKNSLTTSHRLTTAAPPQMTSLKQGPHSTPPAKSKSVQPQPSSHRKKVVGAGEVVVKSAPRNEHTHSTAQLCKSNSAGETRSLGSMSSRGRGAFSGQSKVCGPRQGAGTAGQQAVKNSSKVEESLAEKPVQMPKSELGSPRQPSSHQRISATCDTRTSKAAPSIHESPVIRNESDSEKDTGLWGKVKSESLRRICEDVGAAVSGNRNLLISRIFSRLDGRAMQGRAEFVPTSEDLSRLRMSTLRRVCGDLAVSMNGNKEALIWRLVAVFAAEGQASLELAGSLGDMCKGKISHTGLTRSCGAEGLPDPAHIWQEWPCDGCGRADREEEMVLCDSCDAGWHLDCLSPALPAVPDGDWLCPECAVGNRDSGSLSDLSAQATPGNKGRLEGSRKRVRYAMLRTSTARNLDRFELPSGRSSRGVVTTKRQRVPVSRFRFSGIEAAPV